MTEVMQETENILDKGNMIEIENGTFHSEEHPEVIIIQEGHTKNKRIIEKEMTAESRCSDIDSDHHIDDLELHLGFPAEIKTDGLVAASLVIYQNFSWEEHFFKQSAVQRRSNKCKGCPCLYEGDQKEDDAQEG